MGKKTWDRRRVVSELRKEGYKLISKEREIGSRTELKTHCKQGHEFKTNMNKFTIHNHRCKECKKTVRNKEYEMFKNAVEDADKNIIVVGTYKSPQQPIDVKHTDCGSVWGVLPDKFVDDIRCTFCNPNSQKKSHAEFLEEVKELHGDEYLVLGIYSSNRKHVKIKHNKCGHSWNVNPRNFLINKRGCPQCKQSKGEKAIESYLKRNNLIFEMQFKYDDCKNKNSLPFDFNIEGILLEYDGELHFKEGRFIFDLDERKEKLYKTQQHDLIKNTYCKQNDIPLIRIPYWEYNNVENIMDHVLGYFNIVNKSDVDEELVHKFLVNHPDWSHEEYIMQAK